MRCASWGAAVAVAFALPLLCLCGQQPTCVAQQAPSIKNGLFHLQYDSQINKTGDPGIFQFSRCVFNHVRQKPVSIDWQDTGASGVTDDDGLVKAEFQWPSKEF